MSWRNQDTHKAETKAVKEALAAAGINARVGHGRGTAWGWLEINIGERRLKHQANDGGFVKELTRQEMGKYPIALRCVGNCSACKKERDLSEKTLKIAQEVTGRHGEYHGDISILTQDHWDDKKGNIPILQPDEK